MTTAAEKKTTAAAKTAEALPDVASCLSLRQKLVEMRKACPEILKKKHSDGVSYSYAKIYDVWEKITPIMNQLGVDFDVIAETATKHSDNGDPLYWITMQTKTRNGDKLMFLYEADLTIRWTNLDNEDETIEAVIHSIGWNDDPAKAKGAAHTYALKYYLFEKFTVDQGEDDPDNNDFSAQGKGSGSAGAARQGQSSGRLSDAQLGRLYKKAEAAGMSRERTDARILEKYKKQDPATLGQLVFSPLRRHSQKPDEVRDRIVELMGDLPRIELFARETAPGWDSWGNEVPTPAECEETNGQQTDRGGHEAEAAGQV